jgi:hypothetical protein
MTYRDRDIISFAEGRPDVKPGLCYGGADVTVDGREWSG